ncbi:SRPBCC family protein [Streptomyces sp. NPDC090109]|uniref:SRPBCC family protein n=1 Tax=unclassified Streptomyces TaxID=2593676 RepID=UPI000EF7768E|nr:MULTISPECIES: SRPBCC family protein [unclassified Streptomyces]MZE50566.1 carbon monoxide dehydrogenase [Streptomyces sp. SID5770]
MEHELFVPVPAEALRATLTDPARVVRCVPGLQRDAGADPLAGRLRVRVGGHTITYRGALRIVERDGAITYEGEGAEVRGKGGAELSLTVVLTPVAEGTSLSFTGALTATGRLAGETDATRTAAGTRLLDRFVETLTEVAGEESGGGAGAGFGADAGAGGASGGEGAEGSGAAEGAQGAERADNGADDNTDNTDDNAAADGGVDDDGVDDGVEEPSDRGVVFDAPPPALDPLPGEAFGDAPIEFPAPQPAAEAAHARRTMIGRSAEEVDHAPPRGRYAPVPAPETTSAGATLRWIAPAAALALASAVVVGRALRRRR